MYKTQKNLFTIDILGGVKKLRSTKHTSCSLYFLKLCLYFHFFPLFVIWLGSFIKIWKCKITELLQDIWLWLVSTTHLPPCHFDHFQKKKKKMTNANDHNPSACKYFIVVKWVSFFWLAYLSLKNWDQID